MAFLKINNFTVPITLGSQVSFEEVQAMARTHGGRMRMGRRGTPRVWSFVTAPMLDADATHLENMLRGEGFYWEFEGSLYSDEKGLGPDAGYSAAGAVSAAYPGGRGYMIVSSSTSITWDTGRDSDDWLLSAYLLDYDAGSTWAHIALASDGTEYYDGDSSGSPYGVSNILSEAAGAVTVTAKRLSGINGTVLMTGLTFQPWAVPAEAVAGMATLDTDHSRAGGRAPFVLATGEGVNNEVVDAAGSGVTSKRIGGFNAGTWENARRVVSFKIIEQLPNGFGG